MNRIKPFNPLPKILLRIKFWFRHTNGGQRKDVAGPLSTGRRHLFQDKRWLGLMDDLCQLSLSQA